MTDYEELFKKLGKKAFIAELSKEMNWMAAAVIACQIENKLRGKK